MEALIRQQVAAYEAQLRETLARTLTAKAGGATRRTKRCKTASKSRRAHAPRRTPEALDALGEDFIAAVESAPGETMLTLAPQLGLSAEELERPVARLKKAGRLKTVGERSRMRYYPLTPRAA